MVAAGSEALAIDVKLWQSTLDSFICCRMSRNSLSYVPHSSKYGSENGSHITGVIAGEGQSKEQSQRQTGTES